MLTAETNNILCTALRTCRPHGGKGVKVLRDAIQGTFPDHASIDASGNLWIVTDPTSKTLFQAHLDSVHRRDGKQAIIWTTASESIISTPDGYCLGADDGAGCAILAHLISHNVPGTYCFTQGEECGGIGGKWIKTNLPKKLKYFNRCIAFDRKGKTDICGAQSCGNCASELFVKTLSDKLGMQHSWARGSYTDNAEYRGVITEIVNISVGYEAAHTKYETLDYAYLNRLADRLLTIDWETLPTVGPAPDPVYDYEFDRSWSNYGRASWPTTGPQAVPALRDEPNGYRSLQKALATPSRPMVQPLNRPVARRRTKDVLTMLQAIQSGGAQSLFDLYGFDPKDDQDDCEIINQVLESIVWDAYNLGLDQ